MFCESNWGQWRLSPGDSLNGLKLTIATQFLSQVADRYLALTPQPTPILQRLATLQPRVLGVDRHDISMVEIIAIAMTQNMHPQVMNTQRFSRTHCRKIAK
jgi:hypothetical protein